MNPPQTKRCSKCNETKPVEDFHRHSRMRDGRQNYCKTCCRSYYDDNLEASRDSSRKSQLSAKYGLSVEDFHAMWDRQEGKCRICSTELSIGCRKSTNYAVDHNHRTGKVRGLLCPPCNRGLGFFRDNPAFLFAGGEYLILEGDYGTQATEGASAPS